MSLSADHHVPGGAINLAHAVWVTDWATHGACRSGDPDTLFVQGAEQNRAKAVCMGCPVRTECLADALDNGVEFGVWGGMTERERRALLKRRSNVTSWRRLLQHAREEHLRSLQAGHGDLECAAS
jgi:WhiB family redox-sensing transcriptional regulator